ncbi:uncharacterized protein LOC123295668 [Chrysoperla carnea]|uniref:uncharacterized protein LOC123295668 n=1 Tax=Chrysoperla carnea TaxID=189513 RepID=UPI001D08A1FD|nr:uncharacterized protein LOC123295668 [Chrysoperla carnea]
MTFYTIITFTCILHNIITVVNGYPSWKNMDRSQNLLINNIDKKKDGSAFISRGWAAGGMPFNVLYLSQPPPTRMNNLSPASTLSSFKQHKMTSSTNQKHNSKSNEIVNQTPRHPPAPAGTRKNTFRKSYSVIPQLFVSYGWGPLGRK